MGWDAAGNGHAGALKINCKGSKNVQTYGECSAPSKQSGSSCAALQPCCASQPLSPSGLPWALGAPDEAGWHTQLSTVVSCLASAVSPRWHCLWAPHGPAAAAGLAVRDPRDPGLTQGHPASTASPATHTCSSSVQVCILKITTVWRQKESLFYD